VIFTILFLLLSKIYRVVYTS